MAHLVISLAISTIIFVFLPVACPAESIMKSEEDDLNINLTPEEISWLKNHHTIRIAGPRSFPPFHYYDEESELKGMAADYILEITRYLGIEVEIQKDLPWPEVLKRAKEKKVDMISCSAKTIDREVYLNFSVPYLSFPLVIISEKNSPFISGLNDLHGKTVALTKGVSTIEWLRRDNIAITPYLVDSPLGALKATSFGEADANIENLATASFLIQKNGLTNLKVAAPTTYGNYNLYIAVRKDWPEFVTIVNKALSAIPQDQQSLMRNKWLSVRYEHGIRTTDILKWVLLVILIATVFLVVILLWNRRLQQEIAERKKAEEKRKATINELQEALDNIKILKGLVPICAHCKKIRDDEGYWNHLEAYIEEHSDAQFSHGLCEDCAHQLYGQSEWYKKSGNM